MGAELKWERIVWSRSGRYESLQAYEVLLSLGVVSLDKMNCGLMMRVTSLTEEIGTLDVEAVALVQDRLGHGIQGCQDHDGRTRNHNVDLAEFLHRLGNHGLNVLDAAGITLYKQGALVAHLLGDILGSVGV